MAHKKGQGSTKNGRDSNSKRLGVKLYGGQSAISGNIIIRQRGTKYHPGTGVGIGKDHTIYAITDGVVTFTTKKNNKKFVSVLPIGEAVATPPKKAAKSAEKPKPAPKKKAASKEEAPKVEAAAIAEKNTEAKPETPAPVVEKNTEAKAEVPAAAEKAPAKAEAPAKKTTPKKSGKGDDLKKIEGIGPKIAETLTNAGVGTYAELANTTPEKISEIIAGVRGNHVPTTWPQQAQLAADGKWDELKALQDKLDGGK